MTRFGSIVSTLRKARGLTQAQLGKRLGVSQGAVSLIEAGTSGVAITDIDRYADAFDVTVDTLCGLIAACSRGEDAQSAVDRLTIRAA